MHIYIDESGIFSNPANEDNVASCVVALVIPSTKKVNLFKEFRNLTSEWVRLDEEVKGRNLNESQVTQIVELLKRYDVLLEITVIDLGIHSQDEIAEFKRIQADEVTRQLKPEHNPEIIRQHHEIRNVFNKMSNQLFVQAFIMFMLIPRTLRHAINYYARRIPEELKSFHWVVDAKDKNITEYERAWSLAIYPIMYTQSIKEPMYYIEGGDYSYFEERFQETDKDRIKYYEAEGNYGEGEIGATKLELILGKSFKFQDSKNNLGLQMADVLANATQRGLNGRLKEDGWGEIGSLMIRKNPHPVSLIGLNTPSVQASEKSTAGGPFSPLMRKYWAMAKSLWLDNDQEAYILRKNRKKNMHRMRPRTFDKFQNSIE